MMIYTRIKRRAACIGKSVDEVCAESGVARKSMVEWNESIPRADRLAAVAKALHTTSEALLDPEADETEAI